MEIRNMSSLDIMENREELEIQMYENMFGHRRETESLAEDIILELADIIREKHRLEWEVARLRVVEEECKIRQDERFRESERANRTMLEALFCGKAMGSGKEEDRKFAEHLCETGKIDFSIQKGR